MTWCHPSKIQGKLLGYMCTGTQYLSYHGCIKKWQPTIDPKIRTCVGLDSESESNSDEAGEDNAGAGASHWDIEDLQDHNNSNLKDHKDDQNTGSYHSNDGNDGNGDDEVDWQGGSSHYGGHCHSHGGGSK